MHALTFGINVDLKFPGNEVPIALRWKLEIIGSRPDAVINHDD